MTQDQQQLLAMLQQDPAAARQFLEANLAEQVAASPAVAMMMQLMASRRDTGATEDDAPNPKRQRIERVRAHLQELRTALASAHDLLDDLAGGLGACAACWGGEESCPACRGRGAPGWRSPDEALFDDLIAPAVKRRARPNMTKGEANEPA